MGGNKQANDGKTIFNINIIFIMFAQIDNSIHFLLFPQHPALWKLTSVLPNVKPPHTHAHTHTQKDPLPLIIYFNFNSFPILWNSQILSTSNRIRERVLFEWIIFVICRRCDSFINIFSETSFIIYYLMK